MTKARYPIHSPDQSPRLREGMEIRIGQCFGYIFGTRFRKFLMIVIAVFPMMYFVGCGSIAQNGNTADSASVRVGTSLPDGWTVYRPDDEFSSILVVDDTVLVGGLNGLFALTEDGSGFVEILQDKKSFRLVKALFADHEGRLWVGHQAGITCFPGFAEENNTVDAVFGPSIGLDTVNGVKVGMVNDFMSDKKGTLYAGTYNGALILSPEAIRNWLENSANRAFQWMTEQDGLTSRMVNAMLCDTRGDLWFGAYIARGGGVACFREGAVQSFNHDTGLADDYVTTLAEDVDGSIWVGTGVYTTGGASRFVLQNNAYVCDALLTRDMGLAGEKVRYIHVDRQGNRWFCSEYDGIAVFGQNGPRIRLITEQDGLPDNEVKKMAEDSEGNLWLACRRGVLRISAQAARVVTKP